MHRRLAILTSAVLAPALAGIGRAPPQPLPRDEGVLLEALDRWTAAYVAGKLDLRDWYSRGGTTIALRAGLVPRERGRDLTPLSELQLLLDAAARADSPATMLRVLRIGASGLTDLRWAPRHAAPLVRTMAERTLPRFTTASARALVLAIAAGEASPEARSSRVHALSAADGLRAAALRACGIYGDAPAKRVLVGALRADNPTARMAAAAGLRRLREGRAAADLIGALQAETDEAARIEIVRALRDVFSAHQATLDTRLLRRGVRAVVGAVGSATWRGDLALVDFLRAFRSSAAIPVLIDVLARHLDDDPETAAGRSGLLRSAAHDALENMTGARIAATDVAGWRAFWQRRGQGFRMAPPKRAPGGGGGRTVAGGFFGIVPVGTAVVFVIDVSGSMEEPFAGRGPTSAGARPITKLQAAKRELSAALDALAPDATFNIVLFSEQVHAWREDLVRADPVHKAEARRFINRQKPRTSTNLWGGLDRALGIRSVTLGARYARSVDELFLLSDGAPSSGSIVDPEQILMTVTQTNAVSSVRINTVFLDSTAAPAPMPQGLQPAMPGWMPPAELMRKLAEANGGRAVQPR